MTTRKRFSKQFKLQAIELPEQSDKPATDVARELGVMRNRLYKWQHELKSNGQDKAFRGPGRNAATEQRSEVAELRRRLAQREEENLSSMGRKGDCWDNAVMERFFGTLKSA